jgi:UDP-GlcNAc:undecaprenyl-phosphate GlcNAc-1-phosphate transferase
MILAIPFIDTFTVSFNRIKQGKSPAKGGKDHTTHHLVYRGFTERKTFLFVAMTSIILGASGLLVFYLYSLKLHYFSLLPVLLFIPIFYFLFKNTHEFKAPQNNNNSLD